MQRHAKCTILQHLVWKPRSAQLIFYAGEYRKQHFLFFVAPVWKKLLARTPSFASTAQFLIMGVGVAYVIPATFYFSRAELSLAMLYKLGR